MSLMKVLFLRHPVAGFSMMKTFGASDLIRFKVWRLSKSAATKSGVPLVWALL